MKAEFNGNGFRAQVNASMGDDFTPNFGLYISHGGGIICCGFLAFGITLCALSSFFLGCFGIEALAQIFEVELRQLANMMCVFSLATCVIAAFFAALTLYFRARTKSPSGQAPELMGFTGVSYFLSIFSLVLQCGCVIANICFLL